MQGFDKRFNFLGTSINKLRQESSLCNPKRHFKRHQPEHNKSVELKDAELNKISKLHQHSTTQKEISAYFPKTSKRDIASIFDEDFKNVSLQWSAIMFFFKMMVLNCSMVTLLEVLKSH